MSKPTLISLFSGAGGLDYGFEAAGFRTGVCVEMNHDSCETLRASRPKWGVMEGDIVDVSSSAMLEKLGKQPGEVDLVIGGPPCQPFSKSGYWARGDSGRLTDPRSQTLGQYLRVVEEVQPRAFLLENVQGLAFKGKDEGFAFLQRGIDRINKRTTSHYVLHHAVLNALSFGVPQQRQRLIIVASRDGRPFRFPEISHTDDLVEAKTLSLQPATTAWDVLHDAPSDDAHDLAVRGKYADLLPSIPEGQNYLWHTDRGRQRAMAADLAPGRVLFGWRRHFWTFLLKLAKARPSWTVQAQPGPAVGPFHWDNRRLSPRELCRIQTMPDTVDVQGNLTSAQRQIGNAVPSLVGEVMAREIRRQLLDLPVPSKPLLLPKPAKVPPPPPRPPESVASKYLAQEGEHSAHPGTGLGRGARARESAQSLWAW